MWRIELSANDVLYQTKGVSRDAKLREFHVTHQATQISRDVSLSVAFTS